MTSLGSSLCAKSMNHFPLRRNWSCLSFFENIEPNIFLIQFTSPLKGFAGGFESVWSLCIKVIQFSPSRLIESLSICILTSRWLIILSVVSQLSAKALPGVASAVESSATEISDVFLSIVQLFFHSTNDKIKCQFGWHRCMRSNSWCGPYRYGVVVSLSSGAGSGKTPSRNGIHLHWSKGYYGRPPDQHEWRSKALEEYREETYDMSLAVWSFSSVTTWSPSCLTSISILPLLHSSNSNQTSSPESNLTAFW